MSDVKPNIRFGWTLKTFGDAARSRASALPRRPFVLALSRRLNLPPTRLVWMDQVHQDGVRSIAAPPGGGILKSTDGCVTRAPRLALIVRSADCVPILLYDPRGRAVAALHAGWRGLLEDIIGRGISAICRSARCRPSGLYAVFGPSIQTPCYEIGTEIRAQFVERYGKRAGWFFRRLKGSLKMSMMGFAIWRLKVHGLRPERIYPNEFCTACRSKEFFSHRARKETGRIATYIFKDHPQK